MTLKNNRAPLLSNIKLCASFQHHMWIQTGVTVRKWLNGVMTSVTLTFCMDITSVKGNNSWKFQDDTMTRTLQKRCDERTVGRMDRWKEGGQDTSACKIAGHLLHAFSRKFRGTPNLTRLNVASNEGKSTDHDHNLISSEGGQDTSASKNSGHSLHAFSGKCPETSPDGRTDGRTDWRTCRKTVMVGRMDQRTHVQVKRGYFRLRTDGQPENIMPPVPKGGCIKKDKPMELTHSCSNSIANTLELLQSCAKSSKYSSVCHIFVQFPEQWEVTNHKNLAQMPLFLEIQNNDVNFYLTLIFPFDKYSQWRITTHQHLVCLWSLQQPLARAQDCHTFCWGRTGSQSSFCLALESASPTESGTLLCKHGGEKRARKVINMSRLRWNGQ